MKMKCSFGVKEAAEDQEGGFPEQDYLWNSDATV